MNTHVARKRFGQNFLKDEAILQRIESVLNIQPTDHLVEIGPGMGALTTFLIQSKAKLTAIEIDRDLIEILKNKFKSEHFELIEADALKFNFNHLTGDPLRLIGNLPYNISTPLIFHILHANVPIKDMHFMLQKEVVERMTALPNQKIYGRLSVMVQYHCQATSLFTIPPSAFSPAPKVKSAFVKLIPHPADNHPYGPVDLHLFEMIVRNCFSLRRKTIHNSLKPGLTHSDFVALNLDPNLRPENLSVQDFVNICNYQSEKVK